MTGLACHILQVSSMYDASMVAVFAVNLPVILQTENQTMRRVIDSTEEL